MRNFEKYFVIKTMSELLAYEIYYHYKEDKTSIKNIEYIYNMIGTEIPHDKYKKQIIHLGISMAINLYEIPVLDR